MHLISLTIALLGSSILAAPIVSVVPVVGTIASSPIVKGFKNTAGETVEGVLSERSAVEVIANSVAILKTDVAGEISSIASTIAEDVTVSIVPTVLSDLGDIVLSLNNTVLTIVPAVTDTVAPLAVSEVEAVVSTVLEVTTVVADIESILSTLVSEVEASKQSDIIRVHTTGGNLSFQDTLALLTPEIAIIMSLISPIVAPITTFANGIAGSVVGSQGTVANLKAAVSSLNVKTGSILSPVDGAVVSLTS